MKCFVKSAFMKRKTSQIGGGHLPGCSVFLQRCYRRDGLLGGRQRGLEYRHQLEHGRFARNQGRCVHFAIQNLVASAFWSADSPLPVVVNGQNVVTNAHHRLTTVLPFRLSMRIKT
jgi:hypothetical protein